LRKADEATPPERGETWLAITRRNYVVRHLPLMPLEAALLDSILGGATVGDALDRMELPADLDPQAFAGTLRGWFERWSAEGFFLRVELPQ
jgi:hypothetical protein